MVREAIIEGFFFKDNFGEVDMVQNFSRTIFKEH